MGGEYLWSSYLGNIYDPGVRNIYGPDLGNVYDPILILVGNNYDPRHTHIILCPYLLNLIIWDYSLLD